MRWHSVNPPNLGNEAVQIHSNPSAVGLKIEARDGEVLLGYRGLCPTTSEQNKVLPGLPIEEDYGLLLEASGKYKITVKGLPRCGIWRTGPHR